MSLERFDKFLFKFLCSALECHPCLKNVQLPNNPLTALPR